MTFAGQSGIVITNLITKIIAPSLPRLLVVGGVIASEMSDPNKKFFDI